MFKNYLARVLSRAIIEAMLDGFVMREIGTDEDLQQALQAAGLSMEDFEKLLAIFEMRLDHGALATKYVSIKFDREEVASGG